VSCEYIHTNKRLLCTLQTKKAGLTCENDSILGGLEVRTRVALVDGILIVRMVPERAAFVERMLEDLVVEPAEALPNLLLEANPRLLQPEITETDADSARIHHLLLVILESQSSSHERLRNAFGFLPITFGSGDRTPEALGLDL
jgi:hypothetical protein